MSKKIHVGLSPLTNTIFAGHVLKDGRTWGSNKNDVTNEAICAVVDHIIEFKRRTGKDLVLSENGNPVLKVVIEDLTAQLKGESND